MRYYPSFQRKRETVIYYVHGYMSEKAKKKKKVWESIYYSLIIYTISFC